MLRRASSTASHRQQLRRRESRAPPPGALQALAREQGLRRLRVGVVEGDDLSDERGRAVAARRHLPGRRRVATVVSANVYQGARADRRRAAAGAQVVVTGRVADPSLAVGPAMAHFGWAETTGTRSAGPRWPGTCSSAGRRSPAATSPTPGFKDVPDLARGRLPDRGDRGRRLVRRQQGRAAPAAWSTARTVKEQLLYEMHDPAAYLTPDVVADISRRRWSRSAADRVAVRGVRGHPRPATLKVIACFAGGWLGEGEISYAGPNAEARARLAADVVAAASATRSTCGST